jgi:hypothetical protein
MSPSAGDQSLLELLLTLGKEVPELVRKEIELLRQEASRVLDHTNGALAFVVLAAAFAIATVSLLLLAAVGGITILLVAYGHTLPAAATLGALIVGLVGGATSAMLIMLAKRNFSDANTAIGQAVGTLARDASVTAEKAR